MTQEQALKIMKTGVNVYLTGCAGSGKTYVINQYIEYLKAHSIPVAITASTGIAATHIGGQTIHAWSGIGIREELSDKDLDDLESKQYLWKRFDGARVLIIDEISMLHSHRLDMIDQICRRFRRSSLPFGGLQVIFSGDFFQLPPVTRFRTADTKDMAMHSRAWRDAKLAICYLTEQHRQEDDVFTEILNSIRGNFFDQMHFEHLQKRMHVELEGDMIPTKLYTHNVDVDSLNLLELSNLKGYGTTYYMVSKGNPSLVELLKKSCLAHEELTLKVGTQVMFIKNSFESGYVNGTRGIIEKILPDKTPVVKTLDGKTIHIQPDSWNIEEDGKVKASISQLPIRLAWAITVHKSQGMSLDLAEIDLSKSFGHGMGYVALSRVRKLSGIKLIGFNNNAVQMDPEILIFDEYLRGESNANISLFGDLEEKDQTKLEHDFVDRMGGTFDKKKKDEEEKMSTIDKTRELIPKYYSIEEIANKRKLTVGTIFDHLEKILLLDDDISINHLVHDRKVVTFVEKHFAKTEGKLAALKSIAEKEGKKYSFDDLRLARLFVKK